MNSNDTLSTALNRIFRETGNFVVIGLTGRTGSGCSTAAGILTSESLKLPEAGDSHYQGNERRKYKIVKKLLDVQWRPFKCIQIRSIITRFILELSFDKFLSLVSDTIAEDIEEARASLEPFRVRYESAHQMMLEHLN